MLCEGTQLYIPIRRLLYCISTELEVSWTSCVIAGRHPCSLQRAAFKLRIDLLRCYITLSSDMHATLSYDVSTRPSSLPTSVDYLRTQHPSYKHDVHTTDGLRTQIASIFPETWKNGSLPAFTIKGARISRFQVVCCSYFFKLIS